MKLKDYLRPLACSTQLRSVPEFVVPVITYQRPDGSSPYKLLRALRSVVNQTYPHWRIIMVGDKYEDSTFFDEVVKWIPEDQMEAVNLPYARERDRWSFDSEELLCSGGSHAAQHFQMRLKKYEPDFVAVLGDDNYWEPDHLETIMNTWRQFPSASIIYTQAMFRDEPYPNVQVPLGYDNYPPGFTIENENRRKMNQVLTSMAFDVKRLPMLYFRDTDEIGKIWPCDMDFLRRVVDLQQELGLRTVFVPKVTAYHEIQRWDILASPEERGSF